MFIKTTASEPASPALLILVPLQLCRAPHFGVEVSSLAPYSNP